MESWTILFVAAALVGFAKTAFAGVAPLGVALFAIVLPARESTGALLPLLLCGDVIAVAIYRRHADWATLFRLLPWVLPGLLLGTLFLALVDESTMRATIAVVLLAMVVLQVASKRAAPPAPSRSDHPHPALTLAAGTAAGFCTMTVNAGGPVTTLYLVYARLPVLGMVGTGAWFYLIVNATKVPFSAGLELVSLASLAMDAILMPGLAVGAALGAMIVPRMDQAQFHVATLTLTALAAGCLLV